MIKIDYKPLSVNAAYTGERYKTELYRAFKKAVTFMLRPQALPEAPYKITLYFGQSNPGADWDNPCKPFCDVLAKKLGFNDKLIYEGHVIKIIVDPGKEFIMYKLEHHTPINLADLVNNKFV